MTNNFATSGNFHNCNRCVTTNQNQLKDSIAVTFDGKVTIDVRFYAMVAKNFIVLHNNRHKLIKYEYTVGPRLSGHQLSGYLYYPAMILQYILSIFN